MRRARIADVLVAANRVSGRHVSGSLVYGSHVTGSRVSAVRGRCGSCVRAAVALTLLLAGTCGALAEQSASDEYQKKARFLAQITNFVEWPENAFPSAQNPLLICVLGDFSFGTALAEATRNEFFHGRKLELRWVRKISDARACHIVFVSRSLAGKYVTVLAAIGGESVLTVGETSDFLKCGGAVSFSYDQDVLQFEVNLGAVNSARLRMSSRLLTLARRVLNAPESAAKS